MSTIGSFDLRNISMAKQFLHNADKIRMIFRVPHVNLKCAYTFIRSLATNESSYPRNPEGLLHSKTKLYLSNL